MASVIRPFRREDSAEVAGLFQKIFRSQGSPAPQSLTSYVGEMFAGPVGGDHGLGSFIAVGGNNRVYGFVGVLPLMMQTRSGTIRVAVASSLMVDPAAGDPLAGAKLLRALVSGPQDAVLCETTDRRSLSMWTSLGGKILPLYSVDWVRLLRPTARPFVLLGRKAGMENALGHLGMLADDAMSRRKPSPLRPGPPRLKDVAASEADIVAFFTKSALRNLPHPLIGEEILKWRLQHSERKEQFGACHRRLVLDRKDKAVGCFIYHGDPGGNGHTLQLLADPGAHADVLDSLLAHAYAKGCISMSGRCDPQLFEVCLRQPCHFVPAGSTIVIAKSADLANELKSTATILGGLAAESWTRIVGGSFN